MTRNISAIGGVHAFTLERIYWKWQCQSTSIYYIRATWTQIFWTKIFLIQIFWPKCSCLFLNILKVVFFLLQGGPPPCTPRRSAGGQPIGQEIMQNLYGWYATEPKSVVFWNLLFFESCCFLRLLLFLKCNGFYNLIFLKSVTFQIYCF